MLWSPGLSIIATLASIATGFQAAAASVYQDSETGFTFSQYDAQYALNKYLTFRIAVPTGVAAGSAFDTVIQVVAPIDVGWAGLSWGGKMTYSPLAVAWANGNSALVSARWTTGYTMPQPYTGATYSLFTAGTRANGSHWQYTAKCTGCTSFTGSNNAQVTLNAAGTNRLAFAYSSQKPSQPSSSSSTITVHDVHNYWTHDFSSGANSNFEELVQRNLG